MNQIPLKERMANRKENYLLRLDTHIDMLTQSLSRSAPVLSQMVSALTVGYAIYEGSSNWLGTPMWAAILIGIVTSAAIESVSFMAVDERDQGASHNRKSIDTTEKIDTRKSDRYVISTFWINLSIVAVVEAIPAIVGSIYGDVELNDLLFRCSLLMFPVLARLGANLYAFRSVRLATSQKMTEKADREIGMDIAKQKAEIEMTIAKNQAEVELYRLRLQQELEIERARALRHLDIDEQKALAGIRIKEKKSDQGVKVRTVKATVKPTFTPETDTVNQDDPEKSDRDLMLEMIPIYQNNPSISTRKIGELIGVSHTKAARLFTALVEHDVLHIVSSDPGKPKTVEINGQHQAFVAGELKI